MATATKGYSEIYSRVCHFVALRKSDTAVLEVQDALVRETIYQSSEIESGDIRNSVEDLFGLKFSQEEIKESVARSSASGALEMNGSRVRCSHAEAKRIAEDISSARDLEKAVKTEWFEQLKSWNLLPPEDFDAAWNALQKYLSLIFRRHGVQASEFLDPNRIGNVATTQLVVSLTGS